MTALLTAGFAVGTQFIVENPADRGDPAHPRRFLDMEHSPLWLMPEVITLIKLAAKMVTFPMCSFHSEWQKYTTLLYSSGFDEWLNPLEQLKCEHSSHPRLAGGTLGVNGTPSSETSAYPADFNYYLARAVASLLTAPLATNGATPADTRTHGPDGNTTQDPAHRAPTLKPPPTATRPTLEPQTFEPATFESAEDLEDGNDETPVVAPIAVLT